MRLLCSALKENLIVAVVSLNAASLVFAAEAPQSSAGAAGTVPSPEECQALQETADTRVLTPSEAQRWFYCGPLAIPKWFQDLPDGYIASQPPPEFFLDDYMWVPGENSFPGIDS